MKNILKLFALCVLVLAACNKNDIVRESDATTGQEKLPEKCDFGISQFNLIKRDPINDPASGRPRNGGGGGGTTGGTTPPATYPGVILLDFDGQLVSGTNWNTAGDINCMPANLSAEAMNKILDRVGNDYAPFNITVTTDESVYNAVASSRRTRVILTETWEWFGQAGGAAFLGSFTSGTNTPCFVFTSLLNYNEKQIGEAVSHEAGHTLGLRHQAVYSGTEQTSAYNYGAGSGEIAWAPIMGCSYYRNLSTWHNGPTDISSTSYQDEVTKIRSIVGERPDDYSNTTSGAAILSTSLNGYITNSTDMDYFSVTLSTSKTLSAIPFNTGSGNEASNVDLALTIYNAQGQLINTVEDPLLLSTTTILNAGQYYISVSTRANPYASRYGMLGKYMIVLN